MGNQATSPIAGVRRVPRLPKLSFCWPDGIIHRAGQLNLPSTQSGEDSFALLALGLGIER